MSPVLRSVAFSIALLFAATAYAQDPYEQIRQATQQMIELASKPSTNDTVAEAARRACIALNLLLDDRRFKSDLDKWAANRSRSQKEREAFKNDLQLFMRAFLLNERAALQKAGFSAEAVDSMILSIASVRSTVDQNTAPGGIIGDISKLRDDICVGAKQIDKASDQRATRARVTKWALGLGGVAVVVVDLAATIPSAGISDASVQLGAGVATGVLLSVVAPSN